MEAGFFLWYDHWHPAGRLIERFVFRALYDAGNNIGAKVSSIIRNGKWFWPFARLDSIVEIQSRLPKIEIGEIDMSVWNSKNGVYSCSKTWEILRPRHTDVSWYNLVWFSMAIPMHYFLLWLVFRGALVTNKKKKKSAVGAMVEIPCASFVLGGRNL